MKNYARHFSKTFNKLLGVKFRKSKSVRFVVVPFMALILGGFMIYFFLLRGDGAAAWFNDAWGYRVNIPVTNNVSAESDVYVALTGVTTADSTKFQADCGDLRFTDEKGNLLSYYIVSGCGTASTTIHVNYPSFAAGAHTLSMYYGNMAVPNGFEVGDFSSEATNYTIGTFSYEQFWEKGPTAYWSFNEGFGTSVSDATGNAYDGALGSGTSAPTWKNKDYCFSGNCLYFDGTNDYVTTSHTATELGVGLGTKAFTISLWAKTAGSGEYYLFDNFDGSPTSAISLRLDGGAVETYISDGTNDNGTPQYGSGYNDSQWHQIILTWDGAGTETVYVDAQEIGQTTTASITESLDSGSNVWIGQRPAQVAYFPGFIDEVKVYDFELSQNQIRLNYNSAANAKGAAIVFSAQDRSFLSDGLVGYWTMDDNVSGDAQTITDKSGNGNDGTTVDGANNTGMDCTNAGKYGYGCDFDGADDNLNIGDINTYDFDSNQSFSVLSWVKTSADCSTYRIITTKQANVASHGGYSLYQNVSNCFLTLRVGDGTSGLTSIASPINDGEWHQVIGVINQESKNLQLYIDGQIVANTAISESFGNISSSTALTFGARNDGSYQWDGLIDEVRIYNRALSAEEVRALYNWAPGPVAYWDFNENGGTSANDKSGNDYTGTMGAASSAPSWNPGKYGSGLSFDGTDDYVTMENLDVWDIGTNSFTASAWFKTSTVSGTHYIFNYDNGTAGGLWGLSLVNGSARIEIGNSSRVVSTVLTTETYADGNWHHFSGVRNAATGLLSIYIDGVFIKEGSDEGRNIVGHSTAIPAIGKIGTTDASFWEGAIDEVRFYNYARTPEQILEDMNAGHPAIGTPVGSSVLNLKLDEGYGSIAHDSSPQGNNGTLGSGSSAPSWTNDGKYGKAMSFDGNDYINQGDIDSLEVGNMGGNITLSAWVNPTSFGTEKTIIRKEGQGGYALKFRNDGVISYWLWNLNGWANIEGPIIQAGSWTHIVGTYDGTSMYLYINGIQTDELVGPFNTSGSSTYPLVIGASSTFAEGFTGRLDDIQIYPFAVTEDQVALLYRQGKQSIFGSSGTDASGNPDNSASRTYCVPGDDTSCSAPVAEYTFNENGGTTLNDSSTNGYEGTLSGGQWTQGPDSRAFGAVSFDGASGYIDIGAGPSSVQTVTFWVKPATTTEPLINITDATDYISLSGGTITATGFTSPTIYVNGVSSSTLAAGTWQHVTITTTSAENANNFDIGRTQDTNYFDGHISQVRLYDYVRTPAQIAWEFDKGKPIAHYRFDECEGTTIYDVTGKGHDGILTIGGSGENTVGNCSTTSTAWGSAADGNRNSGLDFDGADDRLVISDMDLGREFTISFWFKSDNNVGSFYQYIYSHGTVSSAHNINIYFNEDSNTVNTPGAIFMATQDANDLPPLLVQDVQTEPGYSDGTWHHLLMIVDTSGTRGYIDGALEVSYTNGSDGVNPSGSIYIGARNDLNSARYYDGSVDDLMIFNYPVTDTQIQEIYKGGAVNFQ